MAEQSPRAFLTPPNDTLSNAPSTMLDVHLLLLHLSHQSTNQAWGTPRRAPSARDRRGVGHEAQAHQLEEAVADVYALLGPAQLLPGQVWVEHGDVVVRQGHAQRLHALPGLGRRAARESVPVLGRRRGRLLLALGGEGVYLGRGGLLNDRRDPRQLKPVAA